MRVLLLRLDAPMMSFGGPMVDQNGVVQRFPARSMLTGLCANALGWTHSEFDKLNQLQDCLLFAARIDRSGEEIEDYQTVDLSQPWLTPDSAGWTTYGEVAERAGASADGTHIRHRHYRADSVATVALSLADGPVAADELALALKYPARPLFIGRKTCIPSCELLLGVVEANTVVQALEQAPRSLRADSGPHWATWFPNEGPSGNTESREVATSDERDWRAQVHVGRRTMMEGQLSPKEAPRGK